MNTLARNSDPWTSHAAGSGSRRHAMRGRILVLHSLLVLPMNDFELADVTGWQQTSIGKRRLECQRMGWVAPHLNKWGDQVTRKSPSNTESLVWEITDIGVEIAWAQR